MSVANSIFVGWPSEGAALICSKDQPRPAIDLSNNFTWIHRDRTQKGGCSEGCCVDFVCNACGLEHSEGAHGQSPV